MTSFYPIHVNIEGKKCLIVGGGKTAERKVSTLVRYGGKVVVVSPTAAGKIKSFSQKKKILWHKRAYRVSDLNRVFLVFSATDSEELNREICREAKERGILINVVDSPEDCDFISPSLVERGHLKISISTEGLAPLLSKRIRKDLEKSFGNEYRQYTALIVKVRSAILKNKKLNNQDKRGKLDRLLSLNIIDKLRSGEKVYCKTILKQLGVSR
ncbi:MAG: bifunctional precorrin-2 dehydrogenase/sirohydrochlorin ferrochelatase [Deltaproteobacteria bacterium]|nr:bifunctional precorrin-2 dehydrogenase/sirohydrochlorin ferrochelatase [Deltaproteobacteria bacterium]